MASLDFGKALEAKEAAEAGTWITATDPQGVPYDPPFRIHIAGASSRRVRVARNRIGFRFADAQREVEGDAGKLLDVTAEIVDAGSLELAVMATIGWDGLTNGGAPVPFTPENARALYDAQPHLITQVSSATRSLDESFRAGDGTAAGADDASGADGATGGARDDEAAPATARAARRPRGRREVEGA